MIELTKVSLDNLGKGAAKELFERELCAVIENILDPNTPADQARCVTLKVTIKPDKERSAGKVLIACQSKLAAVNQYETRVFMAFGPEGAIATEHNPHQARLDFDAAVNAEAVGKTTDLKEAK